MEAGKFKGDRDVQQTKQHLQLNSASSASSSPSHEFSFTISLHPPNTETKNFPPPPFAAAIDLSPADEIFFHGHLLPLHLLSHLSSRCSTNSQDSFTLIDNSITNGGDGDHDNHRHHLGRRHELEGKGRGKSKSFSLFAMPWRRKGGCDDLDKDDDDQHKQKSRFDLLKRYLRFMKPFLSMRNRRPGNSGELLPKQQYSYSANLRVKNKKNLMRGQRGVLSAPASMRTSPANSGVLVASGTSTPTTKSDSTMEELQAAIQAAIAHCKNSIAPEDQIKLPP